MDEDYLLPIVIIIGICLSVGNCLGILSYSYILEHFQRREEERARRQQTEDEIISAEQGENLVSSAPPQSQVNSVEDLSVLANSAFCGLNQMGNCSEYASASVSIELQDCPQQFGEGQRIHHLQPDFERMETPPPPYEP